MSDGGDVGRLLDAIGEPILVAEPDGRILLANPAARRLIGRDPAGGNLADLVEDPEALRRYLRRCSGAAAELPGAFVLRDPSGARHSLRSQGALLTPAAAGRLARVVLRCRPHGPDEFSILRRSIDELNREIRLRQRALLDLEAAVRHRDTLLAELHHRMKNNTQMLLGMLAAAQRAGPGPEVADFIDVFRARLTAIGAAQQVMYQLEEVEGVSAAIFIPGLCRAIAGSWPEGACIEATAEAVELRNDAAVPLALIINELAINALKHGLRFGPGLVTVDLRRSGRDLVLTVRDSGPGFEAAAPQTAAASGLGLVRALCRQIGGMVEIGQGSGSACRVRFPNGGEESP